MWKEKKFGNNKFKIMNSKIEHLPINWKNGMAFSEAHLKNQYLAMVDSIRDATALSITSYNYGLLGGDVQRKFSNSFRDNINIEKVEVSYCRAVTQNGSRIEILNQLWEDLNKPLAELMEAKNLETDDYWYILLIVDPFNCVQEGEEVSGESPRRKPSLRPDYQLEFIGKKELLIDRLSNAIPIAKFETTASGLKKIENYIPPCARINSYEKLTIKYETYSAYLNRIKESAHKIIDKIANKRKGSRDQNLLADDIDALCKKYLDFWVTNYDEYELTYKDLPPIKLTEFFARLARGLNYTMEKAYDKSHMLQYFKEHATAISVSQFNAIVRNTFESNYLHYDIADSLEVVDDFLETLDTIFKELRKLDYNDLVSRNIVKHNTISNKTQSNSTRTPRTGKRIVIKHSGKEQNLGDGLED